MTPMRLDLPPPPPDPTRQERLWRGIASGLPKKSKLAPRLAVLGVALAAGLVAFVLLRREPPLRWEGGDIATQQASKTLLLLDGSTVTVAAQSRVATCDSPPCIRLMHGKAGFHVAPQHGRQFRVLAGGVELVVVGTRFAVDYQTSGPSNSVEVAVSEGQVDVLVAGARVASLHPGQQWKTALEQTPVRPAEPELDAGPTPVPEPSPQHPPSTPHKPPAITADEFWNRAISSRLGNDVAGEMAAYRSLLKTYPKDPRVALVSFELGRLLLDVQRQPQASIPLLEAALAKNPGAAYVEDALLRLALAKAAVGDDAGCKAARDRSLSEFPKGVHSKSILHACP